jgi:hypothetical protein
MVTDAASQRMANVDQLHKYLAGGLSGIPQPQDTVKCVVIILTLPVSCPLLGVPHPVR